MDETMLALGYLEAVVVAALIEMGCYEEILLALHHLHGLVLMDMREW